MIAVAGLSMNRTISKRRVQAPSPVRLAAFLAALTLGWHASLLVASGLSDSLHLCAQEPDDTKRLACYDTAVGRTPLPAAAPRPPTVKGDKIPAASTPAPQKATEITASITQLTRRADGRYVITLDNGQTWLEAQTKERLSVSTGDTVTIRSELLGARYLRTALGADVRVVRQP
jgi:hypothetical protein